MRDWVCPGGNTNSRIFFGDTIIVARRGLSNILRCPRRFGMDGIYSRDTRRETHRFQIINLPEN